MKHTAFSLSLLLVSCALHGVKNMPKYDPLAPKNHKICMEELNTQYPYNNFKRQLSRTVTLHALNRVRAETTKSNIIEELAREKRSALLQEICAQKSSLKTIERHNNDTYRHAIAATHYIIGKKNILVRDYQILSPQFAALQNIECSTRRKVHSDIAAEYAATEQLRQVLTQTNMGTEGERHIAYTLQPHIDTTSENYPVKSNPNVQLSEIIYPLSTTSIAQHFEQQQESAASSSWFDWFGGTQK